MTNIQEKTFGYFTQEDWLEIKEHIKDLEYFYLQDEDSEILAYLSVRLLCRR